MSIETVTDPQHVDPATGDGWAHIWCCDKSLSICGVVLDPADSRDADDGRRDDTCPTCRAAEDGPCGNPRCPDRTLWGRITRRFR